MSDFFYDGQIRRYLTQFMRVFIGFKYQDGNGVEKYVPVIYGDASRQVANIISEGSENKMPTVPKIACYISGLEQERERTGDPTFISKLHIRERDFDIVNGQREYNQNQGANYTIERLMPSPYKLTVKADIWTSNTDQKLQLIEQILVLFNPTLELQTTTNIADWSALTVLTLNSVSFSSRSIPVGADSDIDIATLEFSAPIWINPPAKVKKLGIIKTIIANIFTDEGSVSNLESLMYNADNPKLQVRTAISQFGIYLIKNPTTGVYECTVRDKGEFQQSIDQDTVVTLDTTTFDWNAIIDVEGGYTGTSRIFFLQPTGYEIVGVFSVNQMDPTILDVVLDVGTIPSNTEPAITAIINPLTFNPIVKFGSKSAIPVGTRYLILDNIGSTENTDGADAWKNLNNSDTYMPANTIIEWNGTSWSSTFDITSTAIKYVTNLTTGIQYKWENNMWLKSFEGDYSAGYWRFDLNA